MNIVIAGGGLAGLATAVVLRKLPFVKSIVILEKAVVSVYSSSKSESGDVIRDENINNHHRYNGLWSPALQCLQSMGIYSKIERYLQGVRSSGYKDVSGRWLAKPFIGLLPPPNDPSLAFIANNHLLKALTEAVETAHNEESPVIIHHNRSLTNISPSLSKNQSSLIVKDSNNEVLMFLCT
jgi:2-polyprenyl-6-methoxyphenol hydroxylase-like FAD-dependent oxidoreductase